MGFGRGQVGLGPRLGPKGAEGAADFAHAGIEPGGTSSTGIRMARMSVAGALERCAGQFKGDCNGDVLLARVTSRSVRQIVLVLICSMWHRSDRACGDKGDDGQNVDLDRIHR